MQGNILQLLQIIYLNYQSNYQSQSYQEFLNNLKSAVLKFMLEDEIL